MYLLKKKRIVVVGKSSAAYQALILSGSPSNYWPLDDPTGTTARDLIGGANGTISGGVTLNQPGKGTGKCMTFDGVDGKILSVANVPIPQVVTVEGWINTTWNGAHTTMFSTRNPDLTAGVFFTGIFNAKLAVYGPSAAMTGVRNVNDGQWHQLVFLFNGTTADFYIDGVFDKTGPFVRPLLVGQPASIGAEAPGFFWLGSIQDVAIYPRALTPAEISAHYSAR